LNTLHFFAFALSTLSPSLTTPTPELAPSSTTRVEFDIAYQNVSSDLSINSATVMPGEMLEIETNANLTVGTGEMSRDADGWIWTAPDTPGHHQLYFQSGGETALLNVFVLTPFENGEDVSLDGYRVGEYNPVPLRGMERYVPPTGFIEMLPGMEDIQIAPHFRLGQFICKQQPGHDPTFLLVDPHMLLKLETLLTAANDRGWEADTFFVMSGFRTPFYNAAIGNTTTSSRHLFGDAADIYIDQDGDGVMDDLNGDGRITREDAAELAALAAEIADSGSDHWHSGGIGIYSANAVHGPFIHVDARGYRARW